MKNYGSIYMRKDGIYQGQVTYKGIRKCFYGIDKTDIQSKMNEFVVLSKYNNLDKNKIALFSFYCEQYLYTFKRGYIKDSSFDRLENIYLCHVKNSSIDIPVADLNDIIVQKYLNDKIKYNLSQSSLKKIFNFVRSVLSFCYMRKYINNDIAGLIICPKSLKDTKQIQVYTDKEINKLYDGIKENISLNKIRPLYRYSASYLIILNCGLRAGEMLALKWEDVDLYNNIIHVHTTLSHVRRKDNNSYYYDDIITNCKTTNSDRYIPLNNISKKCFIFLKMKSDCEFVVSNGCGKFLKLRSYQQTFKRICEDLNVNYKGLHALRHTFASGLIEKGASPKSVSTLLGHASVQFTMNRYVHISNDYLRQAVELLNIRK